VSLRLTEQEFWDRTEPEPNTGCWIWLGCRNEHGYGSLRADGQPWLAHRRAYTLKYGPIPEGIKVCHSCDSPPCCNPTHLFLGTQAVNVADCVSKGRMPDRRGERHPRVKLTEEIVRAIRGLSAIGTSYVDLAERFGITRHYAWPIVQRRTWRHI